MNDHGHSEMTTSTKIVAFVIVVSGLLGGGVLLGEALGVEAPAGHDEKQNAHGEKAAGRHAREGKADPVRGLAVTEGGLRLVLDRSRLGRGRTEELRFRVVDPDGRPVRDFQIEHDKRMHTIVTRRDLTGFQHLHPALAGDGTWRTRLTLPEGGSYRVYADFKRQGRNHTLAADVSVPGSFAPEALPAPAATADAGDGYTAHLDAHDRRAGREAELRFEVEKNGHPVEVEPYLGAGGHLVALREGDMAYLHVHPAEDEHGGGGHGSEGGARAAAHDPHDGAGEPVRFLTTFPSPSRYRLFLQFRHDGVVRTAAFTEEIGR